MPQKQERKPTIEQCREYDLRELSSARSSYTFRYTPKPGQVKYKTITIGEVYNLNDGTKRSFKQVEITSFIFRKEDTYYIENKSLPYPEDIKPIGVQFKFLRNNKLGTYYNVGDLELVS
jgi:hypothetical protein